MGRIAIVKTNVANVRSALQTTGQFRNVLKCSKGRGEGLSHKITKFWITTWLDEHGINYYTEGSLRGVMGRVDIIIEEWAVIIEVLSTETKERFKKKVYPLPTIPVPATMDKNELFELLRELHQTNGIVKGYYVTLYTKKLEQWTPMKKQLTITDVVMETLV